MDAAEAAGVGFIVAFVAVALYLLVFNTVRRRVWLRAYDLPTTGRRAAVADAPLPAPGPPVRLSSVSASSRDLMREIIGVGPPPELIGSSSGS